MRLINADDTREELIATLRDCFNVTYKLVDVVATTINNMPTIQPEPHWIPCEERLPDKEGLYTVTIQCEHVDGWDDYVTGVAEYDEHGWYIVSFYPGQIKVVAWMEFPSAYKGE